MKISPILVGSAARGTWLAGDCDLDIFLAVPEDSSLTGALELARELAKLMAQACEEKYAEHAYIHAVIDGFDVDLVPCYDLSSPDSIKSAVDRTPFHNRYVSYRIKGLEDEVLLLKQFMKGIGVYGSELRTGGFSGYLTELLVIRYGSFLGVLQAASSWRPGQVIDLEGRSRLTQEEPLMVVDPVDPKRNVAAALTLDRCFQFSAASRCFIPCPSLDFFFPSSLEPLSDEELLSKMMIRGSTFLLVTFSVPDLVEDILFPQLRKAEESVRAMLNRNGFALVRSDVECFKAYALMLFELEVGVLPSVMRRMGPPIWECEHLSKFLAAHPKPLSGPYIEGGRAVVEESRRYIRARDLLAGEMEHLSLGKHLSTEVRKGFTIYEGPELILVKGREFRTFMARYLIARHRIC